jgi:DNA invertase Pin-like site-specific DNA recombinase
VTTRPTLLGYVRADALSCAEELAAATDSLAEFAYAEGYTLGTVYTERDAAQSAAFNALLDEVKRTDVRAVVVPTLQHLGSVGTPAAMQQHLEFHQAQAWAVDTR